MLLPYCGKVDYSFIAEIGPLFLVKALIRRCGSLQDSIKLFRSEVIIEEINGINLTSVLVYFIMEVWPGGFTGAAHPTDYFATFYRLAISCFYTHHMAI